MSKTNPIRSESRTTLLAQRANLTCGLNPDPLQAAAALHEMYKKFPRLYNTSLVSSFEPKVIYKVGPPLSRENTEAAGDEDDGAFWCFLNTDASDGPAGGHGSHAPAVEAEPPQRRDPSQPLQLGPDVDGAPGRPAGLGPPPHTVEALRRLGHIHAEGLHLTVGGAMSIAEEGARWRLKWPKLNTLGKISFFEPFMNSFISDSVVSVPN